MKLFIAISLLSIISFACKSIPEKVKADKEKYIQVAKENSKPIDINNLSDIYEQAKSGNVEGKMKYLGVDNIQTIYGDSSNENQLDSVVIFNKSDYVILYDFAEISRTTEKIKEKSNLKDFEVLDDRLFIGKK